MVTVVPRASNACCNSENHSSRVPGAFLMAICRQCDSLDAYKSYNYEIKLMFEVIFFQIMVTFLGIVINSYIILLNSDK